jgi:hypothetical protein
MFTNEDLKQLDEKGISKEMALEQIHNFEKGFPFTKLVAPATVSDGIIRMEKDDLKHFGSLFNNESKGLTILKFVPASGAATRMFKDLFGWADMLGNGKSGQILLEQDKDARIFFGDIKSFAFWENLSGIMSEKGLDAEQCLVEKDFLTLLDNLLEDDGLGYASLPKGLLRFHRYNGYTRTAAEEHLVEGINYARDGENKVKLHFTVSPEHRGRFINHLGSVMKNYEEQWGVSFEISFSIQKPSTDTLAVNPDNTPFRNEDGSLLFRPGGHGALIQNLNELKQDVIFIKNIDNVVPDRLKEETYLYKKVIGGLLLSVRNKVYDILRSIENGSFDNAKLKEAKSLLDEYKFAGTDEIPDDTGRAGSVIMELLNRPIRVCGMVKNAGEPGGGPFWVMNLKTGINSLQVVESSQVDLNDPSQKEIFSKATHFNPVDIVCAVKNYKGEAFDLTKFVDPSTGFISHKSKDGKDLKAQELPGLWNGSMAGWLTLFVEVPLITFNPVKTIMDLSREEHLQ